MIESTRLSIVVDRESPDELPLLVLVATFELEPQKELGAQTREDDGRVGASRVSSAGSTVQYVGVSWSVGRQCPNGDNGKLRGHGTCRQTRSTTSLPQALKAPLLSCHPFSPRTQTLDLMMRPILLSLVLIILNICTRILRGAAPKRRGNLVEQHFTFRSVVARIYNVSRFTP